MPVGLNVILAPCFDPFFLPFLLHHLGSLPAAQPALFMLAIVRLHEATSELRTEKWGQKYQPGILFVPSRNIVAFLLHRMPGVSFGMRSSLAFRRLFSVLLIMGALIGGGCSTPFPGAKEQMAGTDAAEAGEIFALCLAAHGGDPRSWATDINFSMDGEWGKSISRIQPVVTDVDYRIRAEERYRPADRHYAVLWNGPAGTKKVVRTPETIAVYYNGVRETDAAKLRAAALTADAFQLFHLGPAFPPLSSASFSRLTDKTETGVPYVRLRTTLRPGFGFSEDDDVVLWIHPQTSRLFRVHLTLNGFETTQGAHVDTTFLAYRRIGEMLVPTELNERVRGPLRLQAHRWSMTGADFNRGWAITDITGAGFENAAATPASPLD